MEKNKGKDPSEESVKANPSLMPDMGIDGDDHNGTKYADSYDAADY